MGKPPKQTELERIAETGDPRAQNELGSRMYFSDGFYGPRDEAVRLIRLAANQGLAEAQNNLGLISYQRSLLNHRH